MTDAVRQALEWYAAEAEALAKNTATGAHTQAVLASVTVLALDGGRKARAALSEQRRVMNSSDELLDCIEEWAERAANCLAASELPLSAHIHAEGMAHTLRLSLMGMKATLSVNGREPPR